MNDSPTLTVFYYIALLVYLVLSALSAIFAVQLWKEASSRLNSLRDHLVYWNLRGFSCSPSRFYLRQFGRGTETHTRPEIALLTELRAELYAIMSVVM